MNSLSVPLCTVAQLKIAQDVISLAVLVPFATFYMDQPSKLDFMSAGLCRVGATCFILRT